jgi:hypothetical protein
MIQFNLLAIATPLYHCRYNENWLGVCFFVLAASALIHPVGMAAAVILLQFINVNLKV